MIPTHSLSEQLTGFYYIEYTLQNPGKSRKHLFSALGMAFNGWYNRLYTVTGQVWYRLYEYGRLFLSLVNLLIHLQAPTVSQTQQYKSLVH
uniref:Uncharacterized protein n=1 Tax=Rhizophora mucronata TaxID=61149 RepID=A0A2P2LF32_RHIMU